MINGLRNMERDQRKPKNQKGKIHEKEILYI